MATRRAGAPTERDLAWMREKIPNFSDIRDATERVQQQAEENRRQYEGEGK